MPRLFTALDLPPALVDVLRAFRHEQSLDVRTRWTPPENLHLTLRFIGEVDDAQAERVEAALTGIPENHAPFAVEPLGLGVLPSRPAPRVLTVRIDPSEPLRALYAALQDALAAVDVAREERPFRPHVTLARFKNASAERIYAALRAMPAPSLRPFPADRFCLYESTLTPDGAVHTARATYPLTAE